MIFKSFCFYLHFTQPLHFFLESVLYTQLLQHRLHLKHGKTQRAATTLDLFKQKKWTGRAVACYALWMVVSASCPRNIGG